MPLPEQIQRQQEFSDEYDKALSTPAEPQPEPPAPTPEPQPAPAPAPAPPPAQDEGSLWKQRFLSLQGMFNTQVPALQKQVKDLTADLAKAKETIESLGRATTAAPQEGALVTDSDVQAFGGDLVDMVRRAVREQTAKLQAHYEPQIAKLTAELKAATDNVGHVVQATEETAQESFFTKLDGRIPGWEQIQASQEAQTFLASRVPGTRNTWNDLLTGAANNRDLNGVVEIFEALFAQHPTLNPTSPPAQPPAQSNAARAELERQVAPPKTGSAGASPPTQAKRTYSQKEYADESMKVVRLVQSGQEKAALALEAELDAALKEGRVIA
jgi:hypothetical protein